MKKYQFRLTIMLCSFFILLNSVESHAENKRKSVFSGDTCAPPCWFGITAGESSYMDVELLFKNPDDVLGSHHYTDENASNLWSNDSANGHYDFYWRNYTGRYRQQDNSIITIKDNLVDSIIVGAREIITLRQVLEALGSPDDIQYFEEQFLYLDLIYTEPLFVIVLQTVSDKPCSIQTIEENFIVEVAVYYSYSAATELVEAYDGTMQPQLTAYRSSGVRQISAENWAAWLSSEEEISCRLAGRELPITITPLDFPLSSENEHRRSLDFR